jgi:hypothetical protein
LVGLQEGVVMMVVKVVTVRIRLLYLEVMMVQLNVVVEEEVGMSFTVSEKVKIMILNLYSALIYVDIF